MKNILIKFWENCKHKAASSLKTLRMFSWTHSSETDVMLLHFVDMAVIEHNFKGPSEKVTNRMQPFLGLLSI